ncbi:hypothetical protein SB659_18130 [Arthrobacter sp. SIMBA_036]|uniref:hypothetical protein n=1 Tax=Arthrobacter sp. SIMBA_036 TaxID=3085778 RepID=UPI00397BE2A1
MMNASATERTNDKTSSRMALPQGCSNLLSGLWPLVHMRSFETVSGPKADKWLVRTASGLLIVISLEQLRAASPEGKGSITKRLGLGTALTLAAIDVVCVAQGRISKVYLIDAAIELLFISGWMTGRRRH